MRSCTIGEPALLTTWHGRAAERSKALRARDRTAENRIYMRPLSEGNQADSCAVLRVDALLSPGLPDSRGTRGRSSWPWIGMHDAKSRMIVTVAVGTWCIS
jgi:hypothetical protein